MKIWLLTHSEELKKTTGTGKLIKQSLGNDCEIIEWSRVAQNNSVATLPLDKTLLIYLCENEEQKYTSESSLTIENIVIIDGTWQQARKMYNQSPYLKRFKHYEIVGLTSVYSKRRNQKNIGLCTAEVAIHLLSKYKHPATSTLQSAFYEFNQ